MYIALIIALIYHITNKYDKCLALVYRPLQKQSNTLSMTNVSCRRAVKNITKNW